MRVEAAVFLMGCSSGALHTAGSYEPIGMALHFVGSGAPATVANLWDVTDGDIDQMTKTALEVCVTTLRNFFVVSFFPFSCYTHPCFQACKSGTELSLSIATAREVCNLPFINGAAPVVYGIPVEFR